jgi:hypothetical protein
MAAVFAHMSVGLFLSCVLIAFAIRLGRKHKLSFRYTIGWIALGCVGILASFLLPLAQPFSVMMNLSPSAFLSLIAVALLVIICVQLSISISGMQSQIRVLVEEVAFLNKQGDA